MTLKVKIRKQRIKELPEKAINLILEKSTGVFDRNRVEEIIYESCKEVGKPLMTESEVFFFTSKVRNFIKKYKYIYDYVIRYQYKKTLTIELVNELYELHLKISKWTGVFDSISYRKIKDLLK